MREHLLGYLLGALDGPEQQQVEDRLEQDPQLQKELAALDAHVDLLRHGNQSHQPPEGLAERTCALVHSHCQQQINLKQKNAAAQNQYSAAPGIRGWTLADLVVAAGIFLDTFGTSPAMAPALLPVASKNTAKGAMPSIRLATMTGVGAPPPGSLTYSDTGRCVSPWPLLLLANESESL